jgi:hypothetical protein
LDFPFLPAPVSLQSLYWLQASIKIIATINQQGPRFAENEVISFRSSDNGKLLKTMTSDSFESPVVFRYHGENFLHVSTTPSGSGGFVTDTIFWIAPDATMHEIEFENAAKNYESKVDPEETILSGGGVNCDDGKLTFEFYIANDDDAHCCPTGGKVTGNYEIIGTKQFDPTTKQYSSNFKMVVQKYLRTPITGEMFANLAK